MKGPGEPGPDVLTKREGYWGVAGFAGVAGDDGVAGAVVAGPDPAPVVEPVVPLPAGRLVAVAVVFTSRPPLPLQLKSANSARSTTRAPMPHAQPLPLRRLP